MTVARRVRRILAPVDLSDASMAGVRHAVALAEVFGAAVEVVHVWQPPAMVAPQLVVGAAGVPEPRALAEVARAELGRELDEALAPLRQAGGVPIEATLLEGSPAQEVIRLASEGGHDLVVMATRGRGALAHGLMGSVAQQVVRLCERPVLTLHPPRAG